MITTVQNYDLTERNTFAMHVKCGCFMEYDSREDIPFLLSSIRPGVELFHIGGGSNVLFTGDFPGIVAHSAIKGIDVLEEHPDGMVVEVGAGEIMDDFILWACERGLWGVERLSGIPGEVGASAVQNVGAYGAEAADTIVRVNAYDRQDREFVSVGNESCHYGYRQSIFKEPEFRSRYIIHSVVYRLKTMPVSPLAYPALQQRFTGMPDNPCELRYAVMEIRNSKLPDPTKVPSAGSFFKNPVIPSYMFQRLKEMEGNEDIPCYEVADGFKIPAAWLIDRCGWKGYTDGKVAVWNKQPLVITNPDRKALPSDVMALESRIKASVYERYGISLTPEVEHI